MEKYDIRMGLLVSQTFPEYVPFVTLVYDPSSDSGKSQSAVNNPFDINRRVTQEEIIAMVNFRKFVMTLLLSI